ncbi:MAG: SGNH/GDSL hydrolase family protein [bacterium]
MRRFPVVVGLTLATGCSHASQSPAPVRTAAASRWLTTWTSSNQQALRPPPDSVDRAPTYVNRTLRQIVRPSVGGSPIRVRFSNEYGDRPLVIGSAHVALRDSGAAIVASTDRAITFGGKSSVTIRPGAGIVSDPVSFTLPPLRDLAITVFLPDSARSATRHSLGLQSNYVSRTGDFVSSASFPVDTTIAMWLFLSGVDVVNANATGVIATIGNSITDGARSSPNTNSRWPDVLARRLMAGSEPPKGVANAGISGNRVLSFGAGPSALARFDRDVLMQSGVTHVIILEGINDIGSSNATKITAEDLIYGLHQLADRAHERGLVVIGATLTPAGPRPAFTPELEAKRQAVNTWIRTSGVFDAVIDFDAVTRDPAHPTQFLPAYDSGDHLHPGDAGYKAMGEAIDLALFRIRR